MKYEKTYDLKDKPCIIALVAAGFEIIGIDSSNHEEFFFEFEDTDELREAIALYWRRKLPIDASIVIDAHSYVSGLIREEKRRLA